MSAADVRLAPCLVALGLALAPALPACGGPGEAPPDVVDGNGTNHTYVVSELDLPGNPQEAIALGLDLDEAPNDGVDNQLGMLLASLRSLAPSLDLQAALDAQVDRGGLILLVNVKALDLTSAAGAGLWIYEGANPTPPACADAADTVCRRHLAGTGAFEVSPGSRTDERLVGRILAGSFRGGPDTMTLPIALSDGPPIDLPLQRAKAELAVSASGLGAGSKLGGAIDRDDLDSIVIPGLHTSFTAMIDADCGGARTPPGCGCEAGSQGAALLAFIDLDDDCDISLRETLAAFGEIITPDVDLDGDGTKDAMSVGVGVAAVHATFTVPPN